MPTVNRPTNRDYTLQIYTPDYSRFRIKHDGTTIYEGKVVPKPGTDYAEPNLSKIIENYVEQNLPANYGKSSTVMGVISDAYKEFTVEVMDNSNNWTQIDDVGYLFWWDYDENPSSYTDLVMNDKVNDHSVPGARYVKTSISNGVVVNLINASAAATGYDESYCGRYGITYLNRRGGYDFFLFEGRCSKTDSYDIYKFNRAYDNNSNGFGSTRYMNVTTPAWTLNTGWMSDEESYKFAKHVVGSNQVWLQDIEAGKTYPVVIEDTQTEYKTFDRNKMFNYTLRVVKSQEEFRK